MMRRLPQSHTTKPERYDPDLRRQVDTLRLSDDFYTVIGGRQDESSRNHCTRWFVTKGALHGGQRFVSLG